MYDFKVFFFFYESDVWCEQELHEEGAPHKRPGLAPPSCKAEEEEILLSGQESNVFVEAGLKHVKVICRREDGNRKRVLVFEGHRDKQLGENVDSILNQFVSEGVLGVRKHRVSYKKGFKRDFISYEQTPWQFIY